MRSEAPDGGRVLAILMTVDVTKVGLFDNADLQLDRRDQQHEPGDRERVRRYQHDAGGEHQHRGEDRVAHHREHTMMDQCRCLARIDTDPPGIAHLVLRVEGCADACDGEHEPECLYLGRVQHLNRDQHACELEQRRCDTDDQSHDQPCAADPL